MTCARTAWYGYDCGITTIELDSLQPAGYMQSMEQTNLFEYEPGTHQMWVEHWDSVAMFFDHIGEPAEAAHARVHRDHAWKMANM